MTPPTPIPSTRDLILDAATSIVRDQGAGKLTLDAAAKTAGLSKGGVLYHFKSKDELIGGMVRRMIDACEALKNGHYAAEPEGPYRHARAVVRMTFDPQGPVCDPVGGALLAAVGINPGLMEPFHERFRQWLDEVASDSPNPALSALVCLAMDGYMFDSMLKLPLYDDALLDQIRRQALDLLSPEKTEP